MYNAKVKEPSRDSLTVILLFAALLIAGYFFSGCVTVSKYKRAQGISFESGQVDMAQRCYTVLQSTTATTQSVAKELQNYLFQESSHRLEEERKNMNGVR